METLNRRKFIAAAGMLAAVLPLGASAFDFIPSPGSDFNFILLGDLHFDKLEHHDPEYLKVRYPNDIGQIKNYSRITAENLPLLLMESKEKGQALNADFYLQLGDFVEGLCGSEALAQTQTKEFIALIAAQKLKRPFFVIKGNHDITGTGAPETFKSTVLSWQTAEHKKKQNTANTTFVHKNARFVFFDCFTPVESLEWLKTVLAEHTEKLLFFCVHYPVVPFNSRSTWTVFGKPGEKAYRADLIDLLGKHQAIVLCGHIHKTNILARKTDEGKFVQVSFGSVISAPDAPVKDHLKGVQHYHQDLVNLEPNFSPSTIQQRRDILTTEAPFITHYEYADFCGHGTVEVDQADDVKLSLFVNVDKQPWAVVSLTALLK